MVHNTLIVPRLLPSPSVAIVTEVRGAQALCELHGITEL